MLLDRENFYSDLQEFSDDDAEDIIDSIHKLNNPSIVERVHSDIRRKKRLMRLAKSNKQSMAYTVRFY